MTISAPAPTSLVARLAMASLGALADAVGLVTFAIAVSYLLDWLLGAPDLVRFIARDLSRAGVSFGLYWIGARFLLSPGQFEDRLLPIRRPEWHYRMVLLYGTFAVSIYATVTLVAEIGDTRAVSGWFLIVSTAVLGFKLWWFWSARHDFAALVLQEVVHRIPGGHARDSDIEDVEPVANGLGRGAALLLEDDLDAVLRFHGARQ